MEVIEEFLEVSFNLRGGGAFTMLRDLLCWCLLNDGVEKEGCFGIPLRFPASNGRRSSKLFSEVLLLDNSATLPKGVDSTEPDSPNTFLEIDRAETDRVGDGVETAEGAMTEGFDREEDKAFCLAR